MNHTTTNGIGGKAGNLVFLKEHGINVPAFFCLTQADFTEFLQPQQAAIEHILHTHLYTTPEANVRMAAAQIQALLQDVPLNERLVQRVQAQVEPQTYYSVRSSANWEDAADTSFAGLFHTYLYVTGAHVPTHIRQCWSLAFSESFLNYCLVYALNPLQLELGLVIQKMITPVASGVLFTANPTGSLSDMLVVAGYGVGEGIVQDIADVDTFLYDSQHDSICPEVVEKKTQVIFDTHTRMGVCTSAVDTHLRTQPVCTDQTLRSLFELGRTIENLYQKPQDIEWCVDDDQTIHILQSRDITSIPPGQITIFDNSNVVESFPGITLPLTYSIMRYGYESNFSRLTSRLGFSENVILNHQLLFRNLIAYLDGQVYYNLSNWYKILNLTPGFGHLLQPMLNKMLGMNKTSLPAIKASRKGSYIQMFRFASRMLYHLFTITPRIRANKKKFHQAYAADQQVNLAEQDTHQLLNQYYGTFETLIRLFYIPLLNDFLLMIFSKVPVSMLKKLDATHHEEIFNGLMCGEADMESVLPIRKVIQLAEQVKNNSSLQKSLETILADTTTKPLTPQTVYEQLTDYQDFRKDLQTYVQVYGDRSPEELKLERDSYREDIAPLLHNILQYASSSIHLDGMLEKEQLIRQKAQQQANRLFRGKPLRKILFSYTIRKTRQLLKNRESSRLDRARFFGRIRSIMNQLGTHLHQENTLDLPQDIHYLSIQELENAVVGVQLTDTLRPLVKARKEYIAQSQPRTIRSNFITQGTVQRNIIPVVTESAHADNTPPVDGLLRGTACSPGSIEAEAVVVDDILNPPDVRGKIMVARMTDPGWVFLMISAQGLIVEKGSLLSHTAIIGRELGIPTVTGVENATKLIKNGQRIHLDASKGIIKLL